MGAIIQPSVFVLMNKKNMNEIKIHPILNFKYTNENEKNLLFFKYFKK